jgi:Flp pilus assembly pilin Flp
MPTLETYRRLAPDHPAWQQRRPGPATDATPGRPDPDGAGPEPAPAGLGLDGRDLTDEDGSLITEYGLLAIVAATVAAAVISWASDGAMATLFNALLRQARGVVGA